MNEMQKKHVEAVRVAYPLVDAHIAGLENVCDAMTEHTAQLHRKLVEALDRCHSAERENMRLRAAFAAQAKEPVL